MKKQFLFAALALATLFTACSKEEELSKNEGGTPVNFVIGGIGARTTTSDTYVATFEEDDEVGLFSTGLASDMTNVKYTVNAAKTGLDATEQTEYVFSEGNATFYAYYPWAVNLTNSTVGLTIKIDQNITNDADNFNCNDLLIATATGSSESTEGVILSFDHVMSFVEVSFGENLTNIGVTSVTMKVKPTIAYDFTSSEATKYFVTGNAIDITMYSNNGKFWAIVPPQTIQAGTALFTITANNSRTYTYTVAADQTEEFNSNNIRKIKLDVASEEDPSTATVFKIASIDINGWGNIDSVTEEEFEVVEKTLNHTATLSAPQNVTNRNQCTDESPWGNNSLGSSSYNESENAITITSGSQTGWFNNTLYYWAGSNVSLSPGYQYTVSFDVKAIKEGEETGSAKIDYVLALKNSYDVDGDETNDNNAVYVPNCLSSEITSASTRISITDLVLNAENYTTLSCTIDPAYLAKDVATSAKTVYSNNQSCDIVISLIPGTSDVTYYIKNVKIVQQ